MGALCRREFQMCACQSAGIFQGGTDARWQTGVRLSHGVRPWHTFRRLIAKYRGDFNIRTFSCLDQFLCKAFAQLTYRESLRDIDACLRAQRTMLVHLELRGMVTRSALADANESRDWRIHCEFVQARIRIAGAGRSNGSSSESIRTGLSHASSAPPRT